MPGPTEHFLRELTQTSRPARLGEATGRVRFELLDEGVEDWWLLRVGNTLQVSRLDGRTGSDADCVLRADRGVMDSIVTGRLNAMAALLRGVLTVAGDPELLVLVQRLFPSPASGEPVAAEGGPR